MRYFWLGLAWAAWGGLHSALLSRPIRGRLAGTWPWTGRHWRFFFSVVALATFLPLAWASRSLDGPLVWAWPSFWPVLAFNLAAVALAWAAFRAYGGAFAFFGLAYLKTAEPPDPDRPVERGILARIRHPLYLAALLVLWGHDLTLSSLVASGVLTAYLVVGTILEERRLEKEWGQAWWDYRKRVSAVWPRWRRTNRK